MYLNQHIGLLDGAGDEITQLDLSFINLKLYKLGTPEFIELVNSFYHYYEIRTTSSFEEDYTYKTNYKSTIFYREQNTRSSGFRPHLFALVPIDLNHTVDETIFHRVEKLLLIMFPSDIKLTHLISFGKDEDDDKFHENGTYIWNFISRWHLTKKQQPDELLLKFQTENIDSINLFLREAYHFLSQEPNDFAVAIESYVDAFHQQSVKMAYINLCIALEAIVKADSEITHRICRMCAVINSDDKAQGHQIYSNVKQFYTLRSKIVHGDTAGSLEKYFFNLTALLSRTFIELITFGTVNRKELERKVIETGFGEKHNLSKNSYTKRDFNHPISTLAVAPVPKYKS